MPTVRRTGPIAAALLALLAAAVHSDDCDPRKPLRDAIALVRADVTAAPSAADVHAALAGTHAHVDAAAGMPPSDLTGRRRRALRVRLSAARRAIVRAERRPESARRVTRLLRAAGRSLDRALALLGPETTTPGCGDPPPPEPVVALNGPLGTQQVFPSDNWWNADVRGRDVLANSDAIIDFIGRDTSFHADFGTDFGIPFVVVGGTQPPLVQPAFGYDDESDLGAPGHANGYPIPVAARTTPGFIEGGIAGGGSSGDRHLLLVDKTSGFLFELYAARWTGTAWTAGSGAIFDLSSNARRPETWTSADAAGLAILPGLVRAEEVLDQGEIRHAIRFTVRATQGYVYPASHDATHGSGGNLRPPLGLRVRMKQDVDLSGLSAPARVIFTAMKTYGLILADNGSDWYVSGAPDPRWDDERMHDDFATITGDDFEAIE